MTDGKRYDYRRPVKYTALEVKERQALYRSQATDFKRYIHGVGLVYFGKNVIVLEREKRQ